MSLDKAWMNERGSAKYIEGVHQFLNFVTENAGEQVLFTCPCCRCRNSKGYICLDEISVHLLQYGIDTNYVVWVHHGEKLEEPVGQRPTTVVVDVIDEHDYPKMDELVADVYDVHSGEVEHESVDANVTCGAGQDDDPAVHIEHKMPESKKYKKYSEMASQPLYPGCSKGKTTLSTMIELQNLKSRYGWTGKSVTGLMDWLKGVLPEKCNLPKNYPNMKNMIKDLGMECETIEACRNGCILYRKEYKNSNVCPKCGVSRYKIVFDDDNEKNKKFKKEAARFVKYFPLIPRLKRFFTIPWIGEAMTWHQKSKSDGNLMRHPCDSSQWDSVNINWPEFDADARNLRLAISTNGFNPHGTQSSNYSCWPVILAPLNLPPSLCMKKEFCLLTLLISRPKAPGKHIDVFLEPLVEELKQLWVDGVLTWDALTETTFTMKAMLLWGIHDFPAYGTLSGCNVHGYKACPVCADDVNSDHLDNSQKICFRGHRRFLKSDHKFRNDRRFKITEHRSAPLRLSGEEVEQRVSEIVQSKDKQGLNRVIGRKRKSSVEEDVNPDVESTKIAAPWSRRSILFDLPYWKFLEVRHNIDVMHIEKNVTEHLLSTLMSVTDKSKDGLKACKDMKELGINKKLWLVEDEETGTTLMPKASYALTKKEKQGFCSFLKGLKLPTRFSSNLSNLVTVQPPGLRGLKSHDYHVIMQHLLPILLRHAFHKDRDIRIAIQRISLFFNILCTKVVNKEDLCLAKRALVEAMCVLERELPPSFFVISVHCMVHLANEAMSCGPVRYRWMYPFERIMKWYKEYTLNKRYIEGSIAEAYLVDESVMYCMEYMPNPSIGTHKSSREEWLDDVDFADEKALEFGGFVDLNHVQFQQVRRWVLNRRANLEDWKIKYNEYSKRLSAHSRKGGSTIANTTIKEFIHWLCDELLDAGEANTTLWRLANGPLHRATRIKKCRVNGFIFSPSSSEECLVTQDSGVSMKAYASFVASRKDKSPKERMMTFYGIVRDILELDYIDFKETVFYCDWVKVEDSKNGCKVDPIWNHVMVNLKKFKNKEKIEEDPFILAQEASGVFYSKDETNDGWHVVLHTPKRLTKHIDMVDIPSDYQSILKDNPNLRSLLKFD